MSEPVVRFFVCHHRPAPYFRNRYFTPIQAGRSVVSTRLDYAAGDDEGDNISSQNPFWSELTALYWIWKNVDADWYGLMHYRRMLTFRKNKILNGTFSKLDENTLHYFGWTEKQVNECLESYDVMTAPALPVHPPGLPEQIMTVAEYYHRAHHGADLESITERVKRDWPDFYLPLIDCLSRTSMVTGNLVVMRHPYFQDYCSFLFGVLLPESQQRSLAHYTPYQQRVWGFLAERLTQAWLIAATQRWPEIRIGQTGVATGVSPAYLKPSQPAEPDRSQFSDEAIQVAIAVDDAYVVHADTFLSSLITGLHSQQELIIHLLCDETLSQKSRALLSNERGDNIRFQFHQVSHNSLEYLPNNRRHISHRTWYRLLLAELLTDVSRVLWLDADMVVCGNLLPLWQYDLPANVVMGACADEGGRDQAQRLGIESLYINAGVLLINLDALRARYPSPLKEYLTIYYRFQQVIRLQDQDVLNLAHQGEIHTLPLIYNVQTRCYLPDILTPSFSAQEHVAALAGPVILHFTGPDKPWLPGCRHPLRREYFRHLRTPRTPMGKLRFTLSDGLIRIYRHLWFRIGGQKIQDCIRGSRRLRALRRAYSIYQNLIFK